MRLGAEPTALGDSRTRTRAGARGLTNIGAAIRATAINATATGRPTDTLHQRPDVLRSLRLWRVEWLRLPGWWVGREWGDTHCNSRGILPCSVQRRDARLCRVATDAAASASTTVHCARC